jgi:hypothetical protein
MEVKTTKSSDVSTPPSPSPSAVRMMMVINNSRIIASVMRAASIALFLALVIQLLLRVIPSGPGKEIVKIFDGGRLAAGVGLFILDLFLDRALRRCPVCRARITTRTEEKRRWLECDTQLWDYWDE